MIILQCDQTISPGVRCHNAVAGSSTYDVAFEGWHYCDVAGSLKVVYCPRHLEKIKGTVLL